MSCSRLSSPAARPPPRCLLRRGGTGNAAPPGLGPDFDRVFRQEATQRHLFQYAALPTLENVFNGYCGAVLAYGQTGTGAPQPDRAIHHRWLPPRHSPSWMGVPWALITMRNANYSRIEYKK